MRRIISATMEATARIGTLTAAEYLSEERRSEVRHEYIGGMIYAMAARARSTTSSVCTERTDRRAKFLSYTGIETLEEYVLVAQDRIEVTVFRRSKQWQPEIVTQLTGAFTLESLEFAIPLSAVYEGVKA